MPELPSVRLTGFRRFRLTSATVLAAGGRVGLALSVLALCAGLMGGFALPVSAQNITQEAALRLVFNGAPVERRTAFLEDVQLARAADLAGPDVEIPSGIVTYYVAEEDGRPTAVAYFDAHRVRTRPEVLMVVVDPGNRVQRVETVTFREPPEYRAPDGWLHQFDDRALDGDLSLKGGIARITGATLTAGAVTRAVRRVLALHRVIDPFGEAGS